MKGQQNNLNFLGWHTEQCKFYKQNLLTYNFVAELISYCKSDVKLLKEGFMEYRRLIQSVCSGIDPFEVACTAASACKFIYRQLFMPKDSIAILPQNGYTGVELTSFPAVLWLCWIEQTARDRIGEKWGDGTEIRLYKSGSALKKGRGREQTLGSLKVDGLLLHKTFNENSSVSSSQMKVPPKIYHSKVLEFFGCYFHGCPSCYPERSEINIKRSGITIS